MYLEREAKRKLKAQMRKPYEPYPCRIRYLVSVWLEDERAWMEDMRFRFIEDANVHAARWGRIYGATVTQITEVEI